MEIVNLKSSGGGETAVAGSGQITAISAQLRNQNRVNISVDGKYVFSLDIVQLVDFRLKVGQKLTPEELAELKKAAGFGKLYTRALEYAMLRPHSAKEIRDYLMRKTKDRLVRVRDSESGGYKTVTKAGYDKSLVEPVLERLADRNYLDDKRFAEAWVENRRATRGISRRVLELELRKKGVSEQIITQVLRESGRNDDEELRKMIAKKRARYDDQKLIAYLVRQGFEYESAKTAVRETDLQSWE